MARGGLVAGSLTISPTEAATIGAAMRAIVDRYHDSFPLRPGIRSGELATQLDISEGIIPAIVGSDPAFIMNEGTVAAADFTHTISEAHEQIWETVRSDLEVSLAVPRMSAIDLPPELLHAILRRGDLIQVGDDLAFTRSQIDQITAAARSLHDGFTVGEFKDKLSMTRRQAVPALEWLDRTGVTIRSGDGRVAR